MSREREGYRENMELLNSRFPDHDMLTTEEVMQVTGFECKKTVRKHMGQHFCGHRISKVHVARFMCG